MASPDVMFDNLKQLNEQSTQDAVAKQRHDELLLDNVRVQETFVKTIQSLVRFLEGHITKTEVVNQLDAIRTPDTRFVVDALNSLHETLKTHENTDLNPITEVLKDLLAEAKQIPKSHNDIKVPDPIDNTKQLNELARTVKGVEKAVKSQKLVAEAPIVNVPETQVNVDAPDLSPIKDSVDKSSKDVVKAVKGIKIPELNTTPLEKLLKKTNKLLEELPDYMPTGGSSGSSWVAVNGDGTPMPIELNPEGAVFTDKAAMASKITVDGTTTYVAYAPPGTTQATAGWRVKKIAVSGSDTVITWADGNASYDNVATDLTALSYS